MTETTTATQVHLVTVGRSSLFHVEGLAPTGSYGATAGTDRDRNGNEKGFVSYSPISACGTLSGASSLYRTYVSDYHTESVGNGRVRRTSTPRNFTPAEALAYAEKLGQKVCTRCTKAAQI